MPAPYSSEQPMRVVDIQEPGGPEQLVMAERAQPIAGPGHVVVSVKAAGVNGPDLVQRRGTIRLKGASDLTRAGDRRRSGRHRFGCVAMARW